MPHMSSLKTVNGTVRSQIPGQVRLIMRARPPHGAAFQGAVAGDVPRAPRAVTAVAANTRTIGAKIVSRHD